MECNKEEGIRAKAIAEKKMESKDFVGASKIAIKAQRLYPDLENISQMISVCDVHCSAESKSVGSQKDWYDILKVEQSADIVSVMKQYYKLVLLLHPDKNKFAGAEAAFMLIHDAYEVLIHTNKRTLFDEEYNSQNTATNSQLKRHASNNGIGSDDETLNSSKRLKTNVQSSSPAKQTSPSKVGSTNFTKRPGSADESDRSAKETPNGNDRVKEKTPQRSSKVDKSAKGTRVMKMIV